MIAIRSGLLHGPCVTPAPSCTPRVGRQPRSLAITRPCDQEHPQAATLGFDKRNTPRDYAGGNGTPWFSLTLLLIIRQAFAIWLDDRRSVLVVRKRLAAVECAGANGEELTEPDGVV